MENKLHSTRVRFGAIGAMPAGIVTCVAMLLIQFNVSAQPVHTFDSQSSDWLGMENVSERYVDKPIAELWYYHQKLPSGAYSNMGTLRYYHPIRNPWGTWRGVFRFDQSYFNSYGPGFDDPESQRYQRGNTMITVWGNHPNVFSNWHGDLGFRVIFPVGNQGQWAVGPQAGTSYQTRKPAGKVGLSDFSPLARFMFGFNIKNNRLVKPDQPPPERVLTVFPTLGFDLSPNTQLRLWDENGMSYSPSGGKWFVPIDAMITHKVGNHLVLALGVSRSVIDTYAQYRTNVYGKISWYF
jgi:hypothetical protein